MRRTCFLFVVTLFLAPSLARGEPIKIEVDAREAPRKILHAKLEIPASAGPLTLSYPKWMPGEHAPSGPILNLAGIKMSAAGKPIPWRRDLAEMFDFHCDVPAGQASIEVQLDYLSPSSTEGFTATSFGSAQLAVVNWNLALLYRKGPQAGDQLYAATLRLPPGWRFGTALQVASRDGDTVVFKPVSLSTLVDSPVIIGAHYRDLDLSPGKSPEHHIDVVADSAAALQIDDKRLQEYRNLVVEAGALFGARHYDRYHFLLTLSDHVSEFGLEHHQSSDDRTGERLFLDDDRMRTGATLLTHEYFHSWNGKYRRPADLLSAPFDQPMKTDLLWVYEGLTEYYGCVLAARCGLWTAEEYREHLAAIAAVLDNRPGRTWRPLQDTADFAQVLYDAGFHAPWGAWRREVDFYDEGELIWLEADVLIRQKTEGRRSLDDFCKRFHGGKDGLAPANPYTFDEVIATMNEVSPNDWREFFTTRLTSTDAHAPLNGVRQGGWKLDYNDEPNDLIAAAEKVNNEIDLSFSLGLHLKEEDEVKDVIPGMPAYVSGIGPGMKLLAVNGRRWSKERLEEAIAAAKKEKTPIELLMENAEFFQTFRLDYHDGPRHPHLERDKSEPDTLTRIIAPRAGNQR